MIKTTVAQREEMYRQHQRGKSYAEIAQFYGVSKECVRYWCRKKRDGGQCKTHYPKRKILASFDPQVKYCILKLRLQHPRWGPNRLLFHMRKRGSLQGMKLPSASQVGRYLRQWARFCRRPKAELYKSKKPPAATRVHQRYELDFKVEIGLAAGERANLYTARDPVGEACIGAQMYPDKSRRVAWRNVQNFLRTCFTHWGTLPEEIQTDREPSLAGPSGRDGFPTRFTLWLAGLGIVHRLIRPGRSTDNGAVERCHRTINDYAIVGREHLDYQGLNCILDQAVEELNYALPSRAKHCNGRPPVLAHPALLNPQRPYHPALEEDSLFDMARVDAFLAQLTWVRKVGKTGQIYLHNQTYFVGRKYARQHVQVHFDPADRHFVISLPDNPDVVIARRLIRGLHKAALLGSTLDRVDAIPAQLPLLWASPGGVNVDDLIGV